MAGAVETTCSFSMTMAWKMSGFPAFSPNLSQTSTQALQKIHRGSSMIASFGHLTPLALSSAGRTTMSIQVTGQALAQAEQPVQRSFVTKIRFGILNYLHLSHPLDEILGFFVWGGAFDTLSTFARRRIKTLGHDRRRTAET